MKTDWTFDTADAEAAEKMVRRLPARLFDAHAHLYRTDTLAVAPGTLFALGPDEVNADVAPGGT